MEVFSSFDENASALERGGKAAGLRPVSTPLGARPAEAGPRRALGDISNTAGGLLTGPGKPRAGLAATRPQCTPAQPLCEARDSLPAALAALPLSERTRSFVTEEVLSLAQRFAQEGVEHLAGRSALEQTAHAAAEEDAPGSRVHGGAGQGRTLGLRRGALCGLHSWQAQTQTDSYRP